MATTAEPQESVNAQQRIHDFLLGCARAMVERAEEPKHVEGATLFSELLARSTPLSFEPTWLPALDGSDTIDDTALGREFAAVAPLLRWIPTMRATDEGTDFALAPLNDVRDFGEVMVGVMYVRPTTQYPVHRHPPQELYLTISGQAQWRFGGNDDFRPIGPDTTLYNNPMDYHSSIAGDAPVVALYILWP